MTDPCGKGKEVKGAPYGLAIDVNGDLHRQAVRARNTRTSLAIRVRADPNGSDPNGSGPARTGATPRVQDDLYV